MALAEILIAVLGGLLGCFMCVVSYFVVDKFKSLKENINRIESHTEDNIKILWSETNNLKREFISETRFKVSIQAVEKDIKGIYNALNQAEERIMKQLELMRSKNSR